MVGTRGLLLVGAKDSSTTVCRCFQDRQSNSFATKSCIFAGVTFLAGIILVVHLSRVRDYGVGGQMVHMMVLEMVRVALGRVTEGNPDLALSVGMYFLV
jgi:hypothetical protein